MKCEEVRDEMIAYLKNELEGERAVEVAEHIVRCQGCQRELEMAREVLRQTQLGEDSSVVRLVNSIIQDAINSGASDIHIDPTIEGAGVRLRIDGVLHTRPVQKYRQGTCVTEDMLSPEERDAASTRIRIMAGVPLSEANKPQDGRIPVRMDGNDYDLRVSTVPALYGEKIVMRILDKTKVLLGLDKLGFLPEQLEIVRSLIRRPNGLIICTGPVGSGRTTLLYSMLMEIMDPAISVMTIEDPVEYEFRGIQQIQVHPKVGLTFAAAVRSFLRQDPDVIMVGEVRDMETAVLTVAAAVTGHLVMTALHTWDAASAITRLANCGVETWLAGSCLSGVIAQRLVRKICDDCREEYTPSAEALEFLRLTDQVGKTRFHRGTGCEKCRGTGFRGRTAIHEVLVVDPEMAKMISRGETDPDKLLEHAVSREFITMTEAARRKVLEGITTAEEAYRMLSVR